MHRSYWEFLFLTIFSVCFYVLLGQLQVCGVTAHNLAVKEKLLNYFDFRSILPAA